MGNVTESVSVTSDADAAWKLVGDPSTFAGWHPAVDSSEVEGDLRLVVLGDGARIEERITERSGRSYSFEILASPLPLSDYSSRLSVEPADEGATITWASTFKAQGVPEAEAEELVAGIYRAGLDAAAQRLG
jgi:carbon monoxide dehydrogenase subunit G